MPGLHCRLVIRNFSSNLRLTAGLSNATRNRFVRNAVFEMSFMVVISSIFENRTEKRSRQSQEPK